MLFKKKYPLGIIAPDYHDSRDYILSSIQPTTVALPSEYDLRSQQSPVQNQKKLGICHAFSSVGISEYWNSKEYQKPVNLSERFVVYNTKKISGLWDIQGDYFRNALQAICDYGTPIEQDYPFSDNWEDYKKEPSTEIYEKAKQFAGKTYWVVEGKLDNIRQAVFQNKCPILMGMNWNESYNTPLSDGKLPIPKGKMVSGHAISGGYWSENKLFFKNSWSSSWGLGGYFYIPFEEFEKHDIWNCYCLLDNVVPVAQQEGWVVTNYLSVNNEMKNGTSVKTLVNLNLRELPNTNSKIIAVLKEGQLCQITDDNVINDGKYHWQKIKVGY